MSPQHQATRANSAACVYVKGIGELLIGCQRGVEGEERAFHNSCTKAWQSFVCFSELNAWSRSGHTWVRHSAYNPFVMRRKQPCHITYLHTAEVKGRLWLVSFCSSFLLLIAWIFFVFIHTHRSQNDSDKEQKDLERRFREKEPERQRYRLDDGRKHRTHYEFDKFMRRHEEELKWGKGYSQDRGKKGNYNYSFTVEAVDKLGKEDKCDDMASKKERIRNKVLLFI